MDKKKPRRKRRLFALIFVPIGFFVMVELVLRLLLWTSILSKEFYYPKEITPALALHTSRGDNPYISDPELLWWLNPGIDGYLMVPNREKLMFIKINTRHYRGELVEPEKKNGDYRILVLGDSSTFGWGVDVEETYPEKLKQILSQKFPQNNVEVINLGVPGYTSSQIRRLLEREGWGYQPDVLLLSCGFNDYRRSQLLPDSAYMRPDNLIRIIRSLLNNTMIYRGLVALVNEFRKNEEVNYFDSRRVPPDEYVDNLTNIVQEARKRKIPVILVPISAPPEYQILIQKVITQEKAGFARTEEALANAYKILKEQGVLGDSDMLDTKTQRIYINNGFFDDAMLVYRERNIVFLDPVHPNEKGHEIIAQAIMDEMMQEGIAPQSSSK